MTIRRLAFGLAALGLAGLGLAAASPAGAAEAIKGFWRTQDGRSVVQITDCNTGICGLIAGLPDNPEITKDEHNPDESKRSRPICKLIIISGFSQTSDTEWEDGTIYNPKNGKTYDADMELKGPATLDLRGYIGITLLGETQTWTRVQPGSFKPCS